MIHMMSYDLGSLPFYVALTLILQPSVVSWEIDISRKCLALRGLE